MLYKGDQGDNDVARPLEGGPVEAGGLSLSGQPWRIDRPVRMPDSPLNSQREIL